MLTSQQRLMFQDLLTMIDGPDPFTGESYDTMNGLMRAVYDHIIEMDRVVAQKQTEIEAAEEREWIACGSTWPDRRVNEIAEALREGEGFAVGLGCKHRLKMTYAYRCVECGRWFDRDCILQHFAVNGDHRAKALAEAEQERDAAQEEIERLRERVAEMEDLEFDARDPDTD